MRGARWWLLAGLLLGCGGQDIDLEDELRGKGDYELVLIAEPQRAEPLPALPARADTGLAAAVADSEAEPAVEEEDRAGAVVETPIAYDPQGEFTVQVGNYQDPRLAGQLVRQLSAEGYPAYAIANADKQGARVRIGYFKTREEADRFGQLFKKDKGAEYWIDRRANEKF